MSGSQFDNNRHQSSPDQGLETPSAHASEQVDLNGSSFREVPNPEARVAVSDVVRQTEETSHPQLTKEDIPLDLILESFPEGPHSAVSTEQSSDRRISSRTYNNLSPTDISRAVSEYLSPEREDWNGGVLKTEQMLRDLGEQHFEDLAKYIRGSQTTLGVVRSLLTGRPAAPDYSATVLSSLVELERLNRQVF
jgi:hypothetical protein